MQVADLDEREHVLGRHHELLAQALEHDVLDSSVAAASAAAASTAAESAASRRDIVHLDVGLGAGRQQVEEALVVDLEVGEPQHELGLAGSRRHVLENVLHGQRDDARVLSRALLMAITRALVSLSSSLWQ